MPEKNNPNPNGGTSLTLRRLIGPASEPMPDSPPRGHSFSGFEYRGRPVDLTSDQVDQYDSIGGTLSEEALSQRSSSSNKK